MPTSQQLFEALVEMDEATALTLTREYLEEGMDPAGLFAVYQQAMGEVGRRFERNEYFIPELIMAGEMMRQASELIQPHLVSREAGQGGPAALRGKLLIATVAGDIHDIGKNIAAMLLDLNGFAVKDLGVDVPADRIVAEARAWEAEIVGLSGLLTLAFDPMKEVVETLRAEGLRDRVKVILGGGQMDEQVRRYVGADAFVTDAVAGVSICKGWVG